MRRLVKLSRVLTSLLAAWVATISGVAFASDRAPPVKPPQAWDLNQLLQAFARSPGLSARFTESKHMALLAAPLESAGIIYYATPGVLARHLERPEKSVLVVDKDQVRIWDGARWEVVDLGSKPVVRMFVDSFVRILQGDLPALQKLYTVVFAPEAAAPNRWTLTLRPKVAPMNQFIDRLELRGDRLVVSELRIIENGGDETRTLFFDVQPARSFSAADRARFFPAPK